MGGGGDWVNECTVRGSSLCLICCNKYKVVEYCGGVLGYLTFLGYLTILDVDS